MRRRNWRKCWAKLYRGRNDPREFRLLDFTNYTPKPRERTLEIWSSGLTRHRGNSCDRHMPRLGRHPAEPRLHRRISRQVEAAFVGHMGIGVEGDVGDREGIGDKKCGGSQMAFHHAQRRVSPCPLPLHRSREARASSRTHGSARTGRWRYWAHGYTARRTSIAAPAHGRSGRLVETPNHRPDSAGSRWIRPADARRPVPAGVSGHWGSCQKLRASGFQPCRYRAGRNRSPARAGPEISRTLYPLPEHGSS